MKATCDWCNSIVKAPAHYQPLLHSIYCSPHCVQKDWLFKQWQNDRYLNHIAKTYKGGDDASKTKGNKNPTKPPKA